jgi:hypothetical protein
MIYISIVCVALIVGMICWSIDRDERREELPNQITKKELRDLFRYYYEQDKKRKP